MSGPAPRGRGRIRRAFAEGLTILVSILLAFGVDAWWEGVKEREEERSLLANVAVEFEGHRSDLQELLGWHIELYRSTDRLIEIQGGHTLSATSMDSLLYRLYFTPSFEPGEGALAGLIGSGKLELIEDERLRGLLAGWGDGVEMSQELDSSMRLFVYQSFVPLLNEHGVPVARAVATERSWPGALPSDESARAAHTTLMSDPAFANTVAIRRDWAGAQREEARQLIERIDSIAERIGQTLGRE